MPEPVQFYNRYTDQIETEAIYGEGFLRFAYENPLGRLATSLLIKRAFFSRWYGRKMDRPASRLKIAPFIKQYGISVDEMASRPDSFATFNEFFSRKLKPSARPIIGDEKTIALPADGRHFVIPDISANDGIFVKGIPFDLTRLLGSLPLAAHFGDGSMLISRLCPVDYHRFHFPCDCVPGEPSVINGPLFSVNPIALRQRPSLLWENERCITGLKTDKLGDVLFLEVGATCVGTVVHTTAAGQPVHKGDEKGYFLFGGSCVITIFERGAMTFADDLLQQSSQGREVFAKMGDVMGRTR